ncbi:hypothetical protein PATSB16_06330 [Pandoraea thiooxydans]|nr:hypothetical protein PATSB16_06330 [Pandoraea thiooxydans]
MKHLFRLQNFRAQRSQCSSRFAGTSAFGVLFCLFWTSG